MRWRLGSCSASIMKKAPCCASTSGVSSRHDQLRDRRDVALTLHHAGELREVRLQPVLLVVLLRRVLQVADHLVDVVFQRGDLALRFDGDGSGQVALRRPPWTPRRWRAPAT